MFGSKFVEKAFFICDLVGSLLMVGGRLENCGCERLCGASSSSSSSLSLAVKLKEEGEMEIMSILKFKCPGKILKKPLNLHLIVALVEHFGGRLQRKYFVTVLLRGRDFFDGN